MSWPMQPQPRLVQALAGELLGAQPPRQLGLVERKAFSAWSSACAGMSNSMLRSSATANDDKIANAKPRMSAHDRRLLRV